MWGRVLLTVPKSIRMIFSKCRVIKFILLEIALSRQHIFRLVLTLNRSFTFFKLDCVQSELFNIFTMVKDCSYSRFCRSYI